MTDDGMLLNCLITLLTPTRNSPFSPLPWKRCKNVIIYCTYENRLRGQWQNDVRCDQFTDLKKMNASPATNLFELTKTLQPVVSRCLLGCPERGMHVYHVIHKEMKYLYWHRNQTAAHKPQKIVLQKIKETSSEPRKIWRKCHSFAWRSLATNSCHGGCWDISWTKKKKHI